MAKKVKIEGCIGCSACVMICPELFEISNQGCAINLYGEDTEIPEDLEFSANEAKESCPVSAIIIE